MKIEKTIMLTVALATGGCVTETVVSRPAGLDGGHVRAAAQAMCASLLQSPALSSKGRAVRIKLADFEDNSRYVIDANIFLKRFRAELNAESGGRLLFLDSSGSVGAGRKEILQERLGEQLTGKLQKIADYIAQTAELRGRKVTLAALPALNTNLVGLNAEGFLALLREKLVQAGKGNIRFLAPGETEGADYWLTGEFYPVAAGKVGRVNLAEYLEVIGNRIKEGRSVFVEKDRTPEAVMSPREATLLKLLDDARLQEMPNCDLQLNVMLTKAGATEVIFESSVQVRREVTDKSGTADFILSGEITNLSTRRSGIGTDYVLVSFKLVDPEENLLLWEGAYEIEYVHKEGMVYR